MPTNEQLNKQYFVPGFNIKISCQQKYSKYIISGHHVPWSSQLRCNLNNTYYHYNSLRDKQLWSYLELQRIHCSSFNSFVHSVVFFVFILLSTEAIYIRMREREKKEFR